MSTAWDVRERLVAPYLPRGWTTRRVGDLVTLTNGFPFSSDEFGTDGHVRLIRIRDLMTVDAETYVSGHIPPSAIINDGDVIVGMDGDFNVLTWDRGRAALNQRLCALRPRKDTDIRFIGYALPTTLKIINDLTFSTTVKHLSSLDLLRERIPIPPLQEQRRVADFLDVETHRIDCLREARRRCLELVSERQRADLVHRVSGARHAVADRSHGERPANHAGPNSTMTGADGVRDDWSVVRLRHVLRPMSRSVRPSDGVVTAFRDGQVALRSNRRVDGYTLSNTEHGYQGVEAGDLVFHALDGFAGAVGISESRGKCSPVYHVCRDRRGDDLRFIAASLRAMGAIGFLELQAGNVRQRSVDFRSWNTLAQLSIALPSRSEQRNIADALSASAERARLLESTIQKQLSLLTERRRALIAAAVTGQIDVTTARRADV